jgi:hypothetical protein
METNKRAGPLTTASALDRLVETATRFTQSIHNYLENDYVRPAAIKPYYGTPAAGSADGSANTQPNQQ